MSFRSIGRYLDQAHYYSGLLHYSSGLLIHLSQWPTQWSWSNSGIIHGQVDITNPLKKNWEYDYSKIKQNLVDTLWDILQQNSLCRWLMYRKSLWQWIAGKLGRLSKSSNYKWPGDVFISRQALLPNDRIVFRKIFYLWIFPCIGFVCKLKPRGKLNWQYRIPH